MPKEIICLDPSASTTRMLTAQKPDYDRVLDTASEIDLFLPQGEKGGLRTKGYFKTSLPGKSLITVVTVVYNGEQFIEKTIQNVLSQTYDNVEYIVIDGGSTDGTLDIIMKYETTIDYIISDIDDGIYDAMNKGIKLASGDWINFMNAGDSYFTSTTLETIFDKNVNDGDIIYGNVDIRYNGFSRAQSAGSPAKLWKGMQFSHQSTFISLKYHKRNLYNRLNKIVADMEFFYQAYSDGVTFNYKDVIISSVISGGLSDSNRLETVRASRKVALNHGSFPLVSAYYSFIIADTFFRGILKKILPASWVKRIIMAK
ncbi:MAG: glycosyltransferase family 2 protein [Daejeonella sp.]|uniref:glycosyltransferase family 2 protein n=1 Tax=Daejeonella sp. TaxID=2805397 RepID=UPI002736978E|nr:glycosyltransferase family 2 protein [Daejeonella sp.]MDP3467513.1 glycosyltransferase family 2 protein [Daejeonella sp.]